MQDYTKRALALVIGLVVALIILVLGDINSTQTIMLAVVGFFGSTIVIYLLLRTLVPTSAPRPPKPRQRAKRPTSRVGKLERELAEKMEEDELREEMGMEEVPADDEEAAPPPRRTPPPTRTSKKKKQKPPQDEDWDAMDIEM